MEKKVFSIDHIISEEIKICQPVDGFRFTTDSLLLAGFVKEKAYDTILEIGAGSGIISVILGTFLDTKKIYAVELNYKMYEALVRTIEINGLQDKIIPVKSDIKDYKLSRSVDMIISNPPYRKSYTGYNCKNEEKNAARFSDRLTLIDIFKFSKSYLKTGGLLYISYTADRTTELFESVKYGIEPKRLRFLYPDLNRKARLTFVEYRKGSGAEIIIEPPLFHSINSVFTEDFKNFTSYTWWLSKKNRGKPSI
ncbi:MAG: methyltransferase [Calditerrivibrio sp.]|nr:methyltransferase [Calditerrivibrio sp.]